MTIDSLLLQISKQNNQRTVDFVSLFRCWE